MKQKIKSTDGRTTKGLRISAEVKERILTAYLELLREGAPTPTAREIAARANLSVRVIFKHYTDMGRLRSIAMSRITTISRAFFSKREPRHDLPVACRLQQFIVKQTTMLEKVAPFRRAAATIASIDPIVSSTLQHIRANAMTDIALALGPELEPLRSDTRRDLLITLHMVCAWPSWETLRSNHGLSVAKARRIMTGAALSILHDTIGDSST